MCVESDTPVENIVSCSQVQRNQRCNSVYAYGWALEKLWPVVKIKLIGINETHTST